MIFAKLKTKNQVTIPSVIVKRLHLRPLELFTVDVQDNFIKLIPVEVKPRYSPEELKVIDTIVEREKPQAKKLQAGKEFSSYIKKISK